MLQPHPLHENYNIKVKNKSTIEYFRPRFEKNEKNGVLWEIFKNKETLTVFKKACYRKSKYQKDYNDTYVILKLEIPKNSLIRIGETLYSKCRASRAILRTVYNYDRINADGERVLEPINKRIGDTDIYSMFKFFYYPKNKVVKPEEQFDMEADKECTSGIHFFINIEDAIVY